MFQIWGVMKGCLNSTKIPKVGIPKARIPWYSENRDFESRHWHSIPKPFIPKSGIPKIRIPKIFLGAHTQGASLRVAWASIHAAHHGSFCHEHEAFNQGAELKSRSSIAGAYAPFAPLEMCPAMLLQNAGFKMTIFEESAQRLQPVSLSAQGQKPSFD